MSNHMHHTPKGRGLELAAWVTGAYFFFELAVGLYTGSVMVLVDAAHTFSAVGGVVLALVARRIALREATPEQTFGGQRAEIIGALLNGMALLVMAVVAITMGVMRLGSPIDLPTTPMFVVAAVGILTEVWLISLMYRDQKHDVNTRGAYWHVVQTFLGSVGIIVAALVIHFTGFLLIDPILGIGFGLMVLVAGWSVLRDSASILMQNTPQEIDMTDICRQLRAIDGVRDVHHPHAWTLTSGRLIFSAHLRIDDALNSEEQMRLLAMSEELLSEEFGIYFSTLQLETEDREEDSAREIDIGGSHQTR